MATPPPVTAADAAAAIARIVERRHRIDDENRWRLTDDPTETLVYLRRYSAGVPAEVAAADVMDGLTLRLRLWWLGEEAELWLLERAQRFRLPSREVGVRLGTSTRQGVPDRLRAVRRKLQVLTGVPDTAAGRRCADGPEHQWLAAHRSEFLRIGAAALEYRDLADDDAAEWLIDVARDVRENVVTPGSVQTLRFALADLSTSIDVIDLPTKHPLVALLEQWARLYNTRPGLA